jgi:hypothetical protein
MLSLFAHAGHGDPRWTATLLHYFIEPQHAWPTWIVIAAVIVLVVRRQRRRENV